MSKIRSFISQLSSLTSQLSALILKQRRLFFRVVYFVQERLYCTEKEAKILIGLLTCIILGNLIQTWRFSQPLFDDAYYAETDSLFQLLSHRADSLDARDTLHVGFGSQMEELLASEKEVQLWVLVDTLEKPQASFPININSADLRLLQALPRIGPSMAKRIVAFRAANGPFNSLDDLVLVKGIGVRTLEKLLPLIKLQDADSLLVSADSLLTKR